MNKHADIWVVAGPPGSGKTTVANLLIAMLSPTPALLDKDTMYGPFVRAMLASANKPLGEREGDWYDKNIKQYEYESMTAVAREISSKGCPVVLSAPFTKQTHNKELWNSWTTQLGGDPVHLVWVKSDPETLKHYLTTRNSERDTQKIANFENFITYMQPDKEPPVNHITIDNRLSATISLEEQMQKALRDTIKKN